MDCKKDSDKPYMADAPKITDCLCEECAEHFAKLYGVEFYYEDFRPGWQEGIDISQELELYRQPYCGCIFSEEERYSRAIRKARKKANKAKKRARLEAEQMGINS